MGFLQWLVMSVVISVSSFFGISVHPASPQIADTQPAGVEQPAQIKTKKILETPQGIDVTAAQAPLPFATTVPAVTPHTPDVSTAIKPDQNPLPGSCELNGKQYPEKTVKPRCAWGGGRKFLATDYIDTNGALTCPSGSFVVPVYDIGVPTCVAGKWDEYYGAM